MNNTDFMLIAHRGASYDAPENTLAAINLAWERDAKAVEIDIQLSRDDRIVVIHDSNTWNVSRKFKRVSKLTLKKLKRLDVGKYKGKQWVGQRIPTLEEVLETVPEGKYLIIEIKCGPEILPVLEGVLKQFLLSPEQILLIGFGLNTMSETKKKFPRHNVLWVRELEKDKKNKTSHSDVDQIITQTLQAGIDGLNIWPSEAIDQLFVKKVKAAKMKLYVWTVNDPVEAKRLKEIGVDGITTDRPQWLKLKLEELN